jgi:hypothetical protein
MRRNAPIKVRKEPATKAEIQAEINFLTDKLRFATSPMDKVIQDRIEELKGRLK